MILKKLTGRNQVEVKSNKMEIEESTAPSNDTKIVVLPKEKKETNEYKEQQKRKWRKHCL